MEAIIHLTRDDVCMLRKITLIESDYYLSYLNINAHNYSSSNFCDGKFLSFMKENFNITKLPYGIKLVDLIISGAKTDELFVKLPVEYFNKWKNYPVLGFNEEDSNSETTSNAKFFNLKMLPIESSNLNDFLHPYDTVLKTPFLNRYKSEHPFALEVKEHANGRKFRPYESYLAYWRSYVIFETVQNCKFIDRYLDSERGIAFFKKTFFCLNEFWVKNYSDTFNRIALYKSFMTRIRLANNTECFTGGEISEFILSHCKSSILDLQSDMTLLLKIHSTWKRKYNTSTITSYVQAIELLKKDIYYLFEWLCYTGMSETEVIEKWSYSENDREMREWSELKGVLDFEELKFSSSFIKYVPHYSKSLEHQIPSCRYTQIYDYLKSFGSFSPWIRGFYDLHKSINNKTHIQLIQSRVIDNLLLISIRTEIVIREIFSSISNEPSPDDLRTIFLGLPKFIQDDISSSVFNRISDNANWKLTKLNERSEDIFSKLSSCNTGKNWSNEQKYFFEQIFKFITSRNYFAHHYYKDEELNDQVNSLARDVLVSCLNSLLYISALATQVIAWRKK